MSERRVQAILRDALPPVSRLWPAIAFGVLSAASAVALLAVSAWLITRASEQPSLIYVSAAVVGVRAFALGRATFRYLERLAGHDAAFRQLATIRARLLDRIVPVAPDGLGATRRGDLLTRLADDVDELQNHSLRVVQPLVTAGIVALASIVGIWVLLPAAGIALAVALALAAVLGTAANGAIAARAEHTIAPLRSDVNDRVFDIVGSLDVLTAFGALGPAIDRSVQAGERLTRAIRSRAAGAALTAAVVSVLAGMATVAALWFGIPALHDHGIDAPGLTILALVPLAVFEVIGTVPLALGARRQVVASADRIAAVVPETIPHGIPVDQAMPLPLAAAPAASHVPVLALDGLTARWPHASAPVLVDVDLTVDAGERVVIEGPTGAGKTALAHVLTRLIDYRGSYRVSGIEAALLAQDDVRTIVGLCEQQPYLFDSDIRQNLLFARESATDDELMAVLGRVGLGDWLEQRGGLSARVGERGSLVSGGQAQRIALARALLAEVQILVVDEPTANVDAEVANQILRDLVTVAAADGRAVILISHVSVPGDLVDARYRMEDGRLSRVGGQAP